MQRSPSEFQLIIVNCIKETTLNVALAKEINRQPFLLKPEPSPCVSRPNLSALTTSYTPWSPGYDAWYRSRVLSTSPALAASCGASTTEEPQHPHDRSPATRWFWCAAALATSSNFCTLRPAHHSNGLHSSGRCIDLLYCTYSAPYLSVAVLRLTVTVVHFFQL